MQFQAKEEHDVIKEGVQKASGKIIAYDKPALKGVNEKFTLNKGDSYTFIKIKFAKPYTFIQIRKQKTGEIGWTGVKTSQLKINVGN